MLRHFGKPCDWNGITCKDGHIDSIRLPAKSLKGSIPSEIKDFTKLTELDLSYNEIVGPIPSELGFLKNLEKIKLGNNRLCGAVPSSLAMLRNLNTLSLEKNKGLKCPFPTDILGLPKLQEVSIALTYICEPDTKVFWYLEGLLPDFERSNIICTNKDYSCDPTCADEMSYSKQTVLNGFISTLSEKVEYYVGLDVTGQFYIFSMCVLVVVVLSLFIMFKYVYNIRKDNSQQNASITNDYSKNYESI